MLLGRISFYTWVDCYSDERSLALKLSWLERLSSKQEVMGSIPIGALCRVVFKLDDESFSLLRSFQENIQSSWDILTQFQRRGVIESCLPACRCLGATRELKQPRRRRQQKPHKFAYLTMKNSIFARFARAFFIF